MQQRRGESEAPGYFADHYRTQQLVRPRAITTQKLPCGAGRESRLVLRVWIGCSDVSRDSGRCPRIGTRIREIEVVALGKIRRGRHTSACHAPVVVAQGLLQRAAAGVGQLGQANARVSSDAIAVSNIDALARFYLPLEPFAVRAARGEAGGQQLG